MRIGIVVDGQAEYRSLPKLFERLESPHVILSPIYADIQPFAPVAQIVGAVKTKLPILKAKNVDKIVVLIDHETRTECPGQWAREIEACLIKICSPVGIGSFAVVMKNTCYENWLVSDTDAFIRMPKRFTLTNASIRQLQPNRADRADAQAILERSAIGASYDKVQDAVRIMSHAHPSRIAENSRSFRRFLRELGHNSFLDQSHSPI